MSYTDYYLSAPDEPTALQAAQVDGFDLVTLDEDDNPRWNTAPGGGRSAFTITRGPITGTTTNDEGNETPIYAEGFYALLRVPDDLAGEIGALIESMPDITVLESPSSAFSAGGPPPGVRPNTPIESGVPREVRTGHLLVALYMYDQTLYEQMMGTLDANPVAKIAINHDPFVSRRSTLLKQMQQALEISDDLVDELFKAAASTKL